MSWAPAIAMGISAVTQIIGSRVSSRTSQQNAANIQAAASANYSSQIAAGYASAGLTNLAASHNARLALLQGAFNARATREVGDYNASLILGAAGYNISLLEDQKAQEWQRHELQALQADNDFRQIQGSVRATQAASGTVMDQDSNADVLISNEAQFALDQTVLRFNADVVAADLTNAQARSSWEARVKAQQIRYEADVAARSGLFQSTVQAAASTVQGALDSQMMIINTRNNALSNYSSANSQASQYRNMAGQQIMAGYLSTISSAANTYAASRSATQRSEAGQSLLS